MEKTVQKIVLTVLLALVAGCYSFETSHIGTGSNNALKVRAAGGLPAEHVVLTNTGWFLFDLWPIVCGNASLNPFGPMVFFRDDTKETVLQDRLTAYAHQHGYDIEELNVFSDEQVMLTIPELAIPIPYLATYRRRQYSCVLVKRPPPPPPDPHARHRAEITREVNRLLNTLPDGGAK